MLKELSILTQRWGRQRDRHEVRGRHGCTRISSVETAGGLALAEVWGGVGWEKALGRRKAQLDRYHTGRGGVGWGGEDVPGRGSSITKGILS